MDQVVLGTKDTTMNKTEKTPKAIMMDAVMQRLLSSGEYRRGTSPQVEVQGSFSDIVWYEELKI